MKRSIYITKQKKLSSGLRACVYVSITLYLHDLLLRKMCSKDYSLSASPYVSFCTYLLTYYT